MKQLSESQNGVSTTLSGNGHNRHPRHHHVEDNSISDQKQLMQFNVSNNNSNDNNISSSMVPTKSGLNLSFVANSNESVSSANCKQCQIDNGRNVIKVAEVLSYEAQDEESCDLEESFSEVVSTAVLNLSSENRKIYSVKCAAHTLQIACNEFLSSKKDIVKKAVQVAKNLRTPTYRYSLQHTNLKIPILSCPTRWNSSYNMLERLLEFKTFCNESDDVNIKLSFEEWEAIEVVLMVLKPAYITTLKLQEQQIYYSELFLIWLNLKTQLKKNQDSDTLHFLNCLEKQENRLFGEDPINAAMFLDPRIRKTLDNEKKERAKRHLKIVLRNLMHLKNKKEHQIRIIKTEFPTSSSSQTQKAASVLQPASTKNTSLLIESNLDKENTTNPLRCILKSMEVESDEENEPNDISATLIKAFQEIDSYKDKSLDVDENTLKYWEENKYKYPNLFNLSQIILAVPCTQVSVERSFSALRIVLSDLRTNLSSFSLNKLLFVKLNYDCI